MVTSDKGIALIKSFEGCRLKAYKCVSTEKYYTIGYGHYGADVTKDMTITQAQADAFLKADLAKFEKAVNAYTKYCFNQNQFDALVSFTYNCGIGNLANLTKNGRRTIAQISTAIPFYNKSGGVVLRGLTRRRNAEKTLFDAPCSSSTPNRDKYYPKYIGTSTSIDTVFTAIGANKDYDTSATKAYLKRRPIAQKNGYPSASYTGTSAQNLDLINKAKEGILKK